MKASGVSIAIIGAGISGLTLAAKLCSSPFLRVAIFEKEKRLGGRVYTEEISPNLFADLGANIIDFQSQAQQTKVQQFLSALSSQHPSPLSLLKQPFLLCQNGLTRKGDYEKNRYFYQNGFKQLISDLQSKILSHSDNCSIFLNTPITKIEQIKSKWQLHTLNNNIQPFDILVLSCNGQGALEIISSSKLQQFSSIRQEITKIVYTRQISLGFQLKERPNYSSILFKNSPISFVSSHSEKYPLQIPIIVMQTSEAFSEQYFEAQPQEIIKAIKEASPEFLKQSLGDSLTVKKWSPSLIKQKTANTTKQRQQIDSNTFITGDLFSGSSRVANAIESSLLLSDTIFTLIKSRL